MSGLGKVALKAVEKEAGHTRGILACRVGLTRVFGTADIGESGLQEGWSPSENGHNWNDGVEAALELWSDEPPAEPCTLAIEGSPYLAHGRDQQRMTLYANGFRLGYWNLSENRPYALQAVVEPEQWLHRDGSGLLKIVWHLPDSVKPYDIGDAEDHRQLGFCFRSIGLEAQPG